MENKIAGFYIVKDLISKGSNSSIFLVTHCKTGKNFAAKIENDSSSKLQYESRLYKLFQNTEGFIQTYSFCNDLNKNILIFDLLGLSVQHYFESNKKRLSIDSVLRIADQVVTRLEVIHSKNFVHRDLRPEHLMTGISSKSEKIFLVDLTSMKLFRDSKSGLHLKMKKTKKSFQTIFSSAWVSLGYECSRRDDLESLWFVLAFLGQGALPWERKKDLGMVKSCEFEEKINFLQSGWFDNFPQEIRNLFSYTRNMKFDSKPDYCYLRSKIRGCLNALGADPLRKISEVLLEGMENDEDYEKIDISLNVSHRNESFEILEYSKRSFSEKQQGSLRKSDVGLGEENGEFQMEGNHANIIISRCPSSSSESLNLSLLSSHRLSNTSSFPSLFHYPIEKSTEL
jgi:serine/threonine protein kinase